MLISGGHLKTKFNYEMIGDLYGARFIGRTYSYPLLRALPFRLWGLGDSKFHPNVDKKKHNMITTQEYCKTKIC